MRQVHPAAWWIWAIGLGAAASFTTNPLLLVLIAAVAAFVVMSRRPDAPWALSFRFYLYLALFVIVTRVVFRIVFGGGSVEGDVVLFSLPPIPLPEVARGISLLGDVTRASLLGGLYEGLRLAAIIVCVGAANSLADPRRLVKALPPALYELATAAVVALTIFPQLAESVRRVHRARVLRGDPGRRVTILRRVMVPVLEDALERSMTLAASMDSRGYGRMGDTPHVQRWTSGLLMVGGLCALGVGTYAYLDQTAPRQLAVPALALGATCALGALWSAGRGVGRTRYRPDRWAWTDVVTALCGVLAAAGVQYAFQADPTAVIVGLSSFPPVPAVAVAVVLAAGVLPAFVTPDPRRAAA